MLTAVFRLAGQVETVPKAFERSGCNGDAVRSLSKMASLKAFRIKAAIVLPPENTLCDVVSGVTLHRPLLTYLTSGQLICQKTEDSSIF